MFGSFRVPTCRGVGPPAPSKFPSFCAVFCVAECSVSCVCVHVCVVRWQSVAHPPPSCTPRGILYHVSVVFRELSRKNKAEASWPPPLPRHTPPLTPLLGFFLPSPSRPLRLISYAAWKYREIYNCGKCSLRSGEKG